MPTPAMPPNWQPKVWPETVEYQGRIYKLDDFALISDGLVHYWDGQDGFTPKHAAFMQVMWQQEGK